MDIAKKCKVILYVLNFQDIIYKAIFRQYLLLKKHKKLIYIIVTHIDLFSDNELFNSNMKIKNTLIQKFTEHGIILNLDSIIPLNLLEQNNDNFMLLVKIIHNIKIDFENKKLEKWQADVENYQTAEIAGGLLGVGIDIISSIVRN